MNKALIEKIKYGIFFLFGIVVIGTAGYELIEGWGLLESFYMTIITISTTGFAEIRPLSPSGRLFTAFLIITGVISLAYVGGRAAQVFVEAQIFRRRRMSKRLNLIGNHYIVCGYGRMGKYICEGLRDHDIPLVVVENSPPKIEELIERGFLFVNGDATSDDVLMKAGIERARGLVAVVKTDAENVFTTLSAKELNNELFVVARAIEEGTESKLRKAGANRVVKPYELGGNRMLQLLLRPGVMDFIDGVARDSFVDISLEEITVSPGSPLVGKSLIDSPVRKDLNIIIVAIAREKDNLVYNPKSTTVFEPNDKLIAIGEKKNLNKLNELCVDKTPVS